MTTPEAQAPEPRAPGPQRAPNRRQRWASTVAGLVVAGIALALVWWAESFDVACPAVYPGDPNCTEEYRRATALVSSAVVLAALAGHLVVAWVWRRRRSGWAGVSLALLALIGLAAYSVTLSSTGFVVLDGAA